MNIRSFLLPLICCFSTTTTPVEKITSIKELYAYCTNLHATNPNTKILAVFDIDDTVATTKTTLGNSSWFDHALTLQKNKPHADPQKTLENLVALWSHIQNYLLLTPVESETPSLIKKLQTSGIPCIALTARSLIIDRTFEQLSTLGIEFTKLSHENLILSTNTQHPAQYRQGIIFNGTHNKGETLLSYVTKINQTYTPDHVVFIDDSFSNAQKVENALLQANIPHTTFHYSHKTEVSEHFDPSEATKQLEDFLKEHPFQQLASY